MTVTTEKRAIETDVHVLKCDGPACRIEHYTQEVMNEQVPKGWCSLYLPGRDPEILHFHSIDCLRNWAVRPIPKQ